MKERVTGKPAYGKKLPLQGIVGNKDDNQWETYEYQEGARHAFRYKFYFVPGFLTFG